MFRAFRAYLKIQTIKRETTRRIATLQRERELAAELVTAFGDVMERYPMEFVDATILPAPKDTMKDAIRTIWMIADEEMRGALEIGYYNLHRFQEGVGISPISGEVHPGDDPETLRQRLEPYLFWADVTEAEGEQLCKDIEDWKLANAE